MSQGISIFYDSLSGIPFSFPLIPLPKEVKRYAFAHPIHFQTFGTIKKALNIQLNQRTGDDQSLKLCVCALVTKLWEQQNPVLLLSSGARISGTVDSRKQVYEFLQAATYVHGLTPWGRTKTPKLRITDQTTLSDLARWADLINDLKFTRLEQSEFERPSTLDEKLAQKWKKFRAYSSTPWKMPTAFVHWLELKYEIPKGDPDWMEILDSGVLCKPVQELYIENNFAASVYKLQHLLDLIHLIRDDGAEKSCLLSFMIVKWLQDKLKAWTDLNSDLAVELFMSEIGSSSPAGGPALNPSGLKVHTIEKVPSEDILDSLQTTRSLAEILNSSRNRVK